MRTALAVLALLALAPACSEEPGTDGSGSAEGGMVDGPRGERCDEMQACGVAFCVAELDAVATCNTAEDGCGQDPARWMPLQEAFAECLIANDCNTTTCDLVAAFTREDGDIQDDCEAEGDGEIVSLARASMGNPDVLPECQALE